MLCRFDCGLSCPAMSLMASAMLELLPALVSDFDFATGPSKATRRRISGTLLFCRFAALQADVQPLARLEPLRHGRGQGGVSAGVVLPVSSRRERTAHRSACCRWTRARRCCSCRRRRARASAGTGSPGAVLPHARYSYGSSSSFSPFPSHSHSSPYRVHGSPVPMHSLAHAHSPYSGGVGVGGGAANGAGGGGSLIKLEPPAADPDYFMNLEEGEGLSDLYASTAGAGSSAAATGAASAAGPTVGGGGESKRASSDTVGAPAWPDDADNIFADIHASPTPAK